MKKRERKYWCLHYIATLMVLLNETLDAEEIRKRLKQYLIFNFTVRSIQTVLNNLYVDGYVNKEYRYSVEYYTVMEDGERYINRLGKVFKFYYNENLYPLLAPPVKLMYQKNYISYSTVTMVILLEVTRNRKPLTNAEINKNVLTTVVPTKADRNYVEYKENNIYHYTRTLNDIGIFFRQSEVGNWNDVINEIVVANPRVEKRAMKGRLLFHGISIYGITNGIFKYFKSSMYLS